MGAGLWTPCKFCLLNVRCGVDGDVGVKESDIPCSAVFCLCIKDAERLITPADFQSMNPQPETALNLPLLSKKQQRIGKPCLVKLERQGKFLREG